MQLVRQAECMADWTSDQRCSSRHFGMASKLTLTLPWNLVSTVGSDTLATSTWEVIFPVVPPKYIESVAHTYQCVPRIMANQFVIQPNFDLAKEVARWLSGALPFKSPAKTTNKDTERFCSWHPVYGL